MSTSTDSNKKGPWGNLKDGHCKDTGIFTRLIGFTAVVQTDSIRGLNLEYMQNGVTKKTGFGGSGAGTAYNVILGEGEFIVGIKGTYSDSLRTLTLISNKKEYGPYGRGGLNTFSLTPDGVNKIVGFHGRSVSEINEDDELTEIDEDDEITEIDEDDEITAIGVYVGPIVDEPDNCLKDSNKKGPWGNLKEGHCKDTGIFTRLIGFTVVVETGSIRGLNLEYMQNGVTKKTGFWGSGVGTPYKVTLGEGEFLVGIKGTYNDSLQTLALISNKKEYGPYGRGGSNTFILTPDGVNKIVGFHGRIISEIDEDDELTAIGVYVGPNVDELDKCLKARDELEKMVVQLEANNTVLKQEVDKTELARDKLENMVAQLTAKNTALKQEVDKTELNHEQLAKENSNLKDEAEQDKKERENLVKLNAELKDQIDALKAELENKVTLGEGEFLVGIRGTYDHSLRTLTLISYKKEYGPYGKGGPNGFSLNPDGVNKNVGFHGRSVSGIDELTAIGVYMRPIDELDKCLKAREELEKMVAQLAEENTALKQDADKTELAAYKKKGPWGNRIQGNGKDTGIFTSLIRFTAVVDNQTGSIRGLNLEYMQKGVMQKTCFGGLGTGIAYDVTLGEGEFLVGIRGTYDKSLRTLTLISNKQEYGPYGKGGPNGFNLNPDGVNKIVGFHGRSVSGIDELTAIGVYMGPIDVLDKCLKAREELEKTVAQLTAENTALKQEDQCRKNPVSLTIAMEDESKVSAKLSSKASDMTDIKGKTV